MAGWKVYFDTNNNGSLQENSEPFQVSNNQGYYEFDSLIAGTYKIREIPHQNWAILSPTN
jgi:protocatechuate 3,4-dioxygenase beta subunit